MEKASLVLLVNKRESGSAAFISKDGYIISAAHCIKFRDDKIEMESPVHGRFPVKLIALDKLHDMMLLKADLGDEKITYLVPAKKMPEVTVRVYQFGAPIFRHGVVQSGTIARRKPYYEYYGPQYHHYIEIIHVAAPIQGGTSGGPWVNEFGEYIGLQSGTLLVGNSPCGLAFMAPVTAFQQVIDTRKSAVSRNLDFQLDALSSQGVDTIKRYRRQKEGLIVQHLRIGGLAEKAGLKEWDLIVAVNGEIVKTRAQVMGVVRRGTEKSVKLTVLPIDKTKSKIIEVPVDIVEDRVLFRESAKDVVQK
ncbi:MAG: serine protease [Lentisphaeraceae bacterium]|nr:serine protease [Lentisphaeraceae bacterium]